VTVTAGGSGNSPWGWLTNHWQQIATIGTFVGCLAISVGACAIVGAVLTGAQFIAGIVDDHGHVTGANVKQALVGLSLAGLGALSGKGVDFTADKLSEE
jgi:hypothetical protein